MYVSGSTPDRLIIIKIFICSHCIEVVYDERKDIFKA